MRPLLAERHLPYFTSIDAHPRARAILARIAERHSWPAAPESGEDLFLRCQQAGLDHARTVLPLVCENDEVGRAAIECLIGHPITNWTPPAQSRAVRTTTGTTRPLPARHTEMDLLVVATLKPNPKKPGTNAWDQYELWRVGSTVGEVRAAGMSRAAITWDLERGFVTLAEVQS